MKSVSQVALGASLLGSAPVYAAQTERVTFSSEGEELVGTLFLPDNFQPAQAHAAVIVTGSWTSVKEQMPSTYARALAAEGFVALAFDFRGWGESAGDFRYVEDPGAKTQDIINAAAFLTRQEGVDPQAVSTLGICASAGYAIDAAHRSPQIQAAAVVAPWLHDGEIVEVVYGGAEGVAGLIAAGREARAKFEDSGELTTLTAASLTDSTAVMYQAPYYTETERGLISSYDNKFNLATWEPWLTYDAVSTAESLEKPVLLVHSESAAIPQGAHKFADHMGSNGRIVWLDDITQFDFYDDAVAIEQAMAEVIPFLRSASGRKVRDEAAIRTMVESVATFADRGEFDALEALYADEVTLDYTSLAGGEVEVKSAHQLMNEWASVLPGFDRTRHQVSDIRVTVDGGSAEATARVVADHWVGELHWQVTGRYAYRLVNDGDWQITYHQFLLEAEEGTREVFGPAMANAKARPVAYLQRQQTEEVVRELLVTLETKDMDRFAELWAEDAVQDMPFSPAGFPKRVSGREQLIAHYAGWPANSGEADFTSELKFYPTRDPQVVFAEWRGEVDIIPTGRRYEQTYGGLFQVDGGKIALFREYFDPAPFAYAFGLDG